MNKYGIVVLNYLNYEDTIECLDTIRDQTFKDIPIVVVDNGSQNGSVPAIEKAIAKYKNIFFIKSSTNLGFAKGNNLGINYLREQLNVDNIFLCNNDLVFSDSNYLEQLVSLKIPDDVGAIGTAIIGKQGFDQNPLSEKTSEKDLTELVNNYEHPDLKEKIKQMLYKNFGDQISKIKHMKKSKVIKNEETVVLSGKDYLHGSAILLTKNYFQKFPGLYPKTFLYGEEIILKVLFEKAGLKMLYVPELVINHKEDKSSALSFVNRANIVNKYRYEGNKIVLQVYGKSLSDIQADFSEVGE
ncbi:glycosyltransferase family 2 protein [Liquorilactobacillus mali]|uniref:glycosyltransferase n=1 Tax=Liquorilactobacillus mali TaxID=1618 RepID=UPI00265039CB|nr:glycosyltransferase family 2 protein [Liquorilactobacillus mali]MDN7146266.1 glycosyltransferase family 2 protein [Liquorilactobacillus mali]